MRWRRRGKEEKIRKCRIRIKTKIMKRKKTAEKRQRGK